MVSNRTQSETVVEESIDQDNLTILKLGWVDHPNDLELSGLSLSIVVGTGLKCVERSWNDQMLEEIGGKADRSRRNRHDYDLLIVEEVIDVSGTLLDCIGDVTVGQEESPLVQDVDTSKIFSAFQEFLRGIVSEISESSWQHYIESSTGVPF